MCEPTTLAIALPIITTELGALGAFAQYKEQNRAFEENKQNAFQSMRDQYRAINERQMQESDAAGQKIGARILQNRKAMASSRVAIGESGMSGVTLERVVSDIDKQAGRDVSTIQTNRDMTLSQLNAQARAIKTQTESRINSVKKGSFPWASLFNIGIGAAKGAANAGRYR